MSIRRDQDLGPPLLCLASDPVSNLTCTSTGNYSPGATLGDMAIAVSID